MSLSTLIIFLYITATIALMTQTSHLLMSLFCLESMMLCLVLLIPIVSCLNLTTMPQMSMIFLTFGACEASLGLTIMVMMSRTYGSDMITLTAINKC